MTLLGKDRSLEPDTPEAGERQPSSKDSVLPEISSPQLKKNKAGTQRRFMVGDDKERDEPAVQNSRDAGGQPAGAVSPFKRASSEALRAALADGAMTDASEDSRFDVWLQTDRMVQRRRLVNQYLECCAAVGRIPTLKNHLQFFLHKPRLQRLDMAGCGLTRADVDAFFSALTGRGCGLKPDKATSFDAVCRDREEVGLRVLDLSANSLGPDGMRRLAEIILDQDFFNMAQRAAGAGRPGLGTIADSDEPPPDSDAGGGPERPGGGDEAAAPSPLGAADAWEPARALTELDVSQSGIGGGGARALQALLASGRCTLEKLAAGGNQMQDGGCASLVGALLSANTSLRVLDISDNNAAMATAVALGGVLKANTTLEELDISYNHVRAHGARALCCGLMKNTTLTELRAQWNGFGEDEALSTLSRAVPAGGLTSLNLAHNRITLKGAAVLAQGIEKATNLMHLCLDGNLLGQVGARMIMRAASQAAQGGGEFAGMGTATVSAITNPIYGYRDRHASPIHGALPSSTHGHAEICKSAFDPCETAGDYELDMRDSYSRSILIKLIQAQQTGRGSFVGLRVNGVTLTANGRLQLADDSDERRNVEISDNSSIDEADWGLYIDTASGRRVRLPIVDAVADDGALVPLTQAWAEALECREERLSACLLRFTYVDLRKRSVLGDSLPQHLFDKLHDAFCSMDLDVEECIELVNTILSSDVFISVQQMEELLGDLSDEDSSTSSRRSNLSKLRIMFITRCFHKIAEAGRNKEFLGLLTQLERKTAEEMLGDVSLDFTPNNPTGFHRLDLSDSAQRDICFRLIEMRNEMEPRLDQLRQFYTGRCGGKREDEYSDLDLERIWRNGKLDGQRFYAHSKVPSRGIVQVDFVQITRPDPTKMHRPVLTEAQFDTFLNKLEKIESESRLVHQIRKESDTILFTCKQVSKMLARVSNPELRVEVCVIAFARIIDWHGYKNVILKLDTSESKMLQYRIGQVNLFDDVMAVDYYELNLANRAQRLIMQELVHLASVEPGNNMIDVTMNGVDFNVPKSWLKEVGRSGEITLYYCREQKVIERVFEKGSWDGRPSHCHLREDGTAYGPSSWSTFMPSWLVPYCKPDPETGPSPSSQPAGDKWIMPFKLRRVKMHLQERFPDPRLMFDALDQDGGGSLDRKEMAMGLYKLGLWLHPKELQALLEVLDSDGGGSIDFEEFNAFWNTYTFD